MYAYVLSCVAMYLYTGWHTYPVTFTWVLGIQTLVFMFAWQMLNHQAISPGT